MDQRDTDLLVDLRKGYDRAALKVEGDPRLAFRYEADRSSAWRGERRHACAVSLTDVPRGVDLAEHYDAAQAPRLRAGGGLDRRQQIRRAIGARQGGIAHRAGYHDRFIAGMD